MLTSLSLLAYCKATYKPKNEGYEDDTPTVSSNYGLMVLAFTVFVVEVLLLIFCWKVALTCTKSPQEKVVHLILATFFTLPYAILVVVLRMCKKGKY